MGSHRGGFLMFTHGHFVHPLPGYRPINENSLWHNRVRSGHAGWDLNASLGTPIVAAAAGRVIESGMSTGLGGWNVKIDHGSGWVTAYFHLPGDKSAPPTFKNLPLSDRARVGDRVGPGDVIGVVGQSGNAAAPHLHLEIRRFGVDLDPGVWLDPVCPAAAVRWIQGKVGVGVDGLFGPITARAVKVWQKSHGLAATGSADPLTLAIMAAG